MSDATLFFQDWFLFLKATPDGALAFTSAFYKEPDSLPRLLLVGPAWSLGVELMFYLIAPFIARRVWRILVLLLISAAIRYATYLQLGWVGDPWHYRFMPAEMFFFAWGALSYHAFRFMQIPSIVIRPLGAAMFVICILAVGPWGQTNFGGVCEVLMVKNGLLIALFVVAVPLIFAASKHSKADQLLGDLSYPVYVCHVLVAAALGKTIGNAGLGMNMLYLALVLAAGYALLVLVDRPINRYRARFFGARGPKHADTIPVTN